METTGLITDSLALSCSSDVPEEDTSHEITLWPDRQMRRWLETDNVIVYYCQRSFSDPYGWNLTQQEINVLECLMKGLTTQEIAEKLFISHHTVSTHRKNILEKTLAKNTPDLVHQATLRKANLDAINKKRIY